MLTATGPTPSVDCGALAKKILLTVGDVIAREKLRPRLDVVRTSTRPDSDTYIRLKSKTLHRIGIECVVHDWSDLISGGAFLDRLAQLNSDTETEAILVQFPVKEGFLQADLIMEKIDPLKDVDGFHPLNMTRLYQDWGFHYESCTAKGILRLLGELNIPLEGQPVCVIGKSRVVGLPLVNMLLRRGSTVTVCHTQTKNLPEIIKQHSIVVVAIGQPRFIRASWIKPQAVIVDVGINIDPMTGKICGDVDYEEARKVASFITPVPGGIGPLTIAMLAENVLLAHLQKLKSGLI